MIDYRIEWARTFLNKADLIKRIKTNYYQITKNGLELLKDGIDILTENMLKEKCISFKNWYVKNQSGLKNNFITDNNEIDDKILEGVNKIRSLVETIQIDTKQNIMKKLKTVSPSKFEKIVLDLLQKMGYGDYDKESLCHTGKINEPDGGIDGIIKQDKLGFDNIYVQAKKWIEQTVGVQEVREFTGILSTKKMNKGVFITTSKFTPDAIKFCNDSTVNLVLVDGDYLTELMIKYSLGIKKTNTFQISEIESEYFDN